MRYYLVDIWRYYQDFIEGGTGIELDPGHPLKEMAVVIDAIEASEKPIVVTPNPYVWFPPAFLEASYDFSYSMRMLRERRDGFDTIRVYDLKPFVEGLAAAPSIESPSPERLEPAEPVPDALSDTPQP